MSLSEFEIIKKYFDLAEFTLSREEVLVGIGDDGALLNLGVEDH